MKQNGFRLAGGKKHCYHTSTQLIHTWVIYLIRATLATLYTAYLFQKLIQTVTDDNNSLY